MNWAIIFAALSACSNHSTHLDAKGFQDAWEPGFERCRQIEDKVTELTRAAKEKLDAEQLDQEKKAIADGVMALGIYP